LSSTISAIDTASNTVVATTVAIGDFPPGGLAVSPDGTRLYVAVANRASDSVAVIDTARHTVVASVPLASRPEGVAVSPDGARLYVTSESSDAVAVIDTASNTVVAAVAVRP